MKKQIHQDVIIGFVCLALCLLFYSMNRSLPSEAAMMPNLLVAMLVILSGCILYQGVKKSKAPAEEQKKLFTWDGVKTPLITWGIVLAYVLLFYFVGYFVATAIIIPVLMRFMKQTSWKLILAIDIGYLLVIYFVFARMLNVSVDGFGLLGQLL